METKEKNISINFTSEYKEFIADIKSKVRSSRLRAALAVNLEVIELYWHIGRKIIEKQSWGSKLLQVLSNDLQHAFPGTHGFLIRNLHYMRKFAANYPLKPIMQQTVAQLPWGHIILLIQRVSDVERRDWYAAQALSEGWSRDLLGKQIAKVTRVPVSVSFRVVKTAL